jgi:hypothetical protein
MKNFFKPDFNPTAAGWKQGLQPIGCTTEGTLAPAMTSAVATVP